MMDWYDKDFGENKEEIITWIMKTLGNSSLTAVDPITSEYSLGYDKFDWDFHFSFKW